MSKYRTKVYCIKYHKYISNLVYLGYCINSRNMRINDVSEKRENGIESYTFSNYK